jgi:DNA adenine methylase
MKSSILIPTFLKWAGGKRRILPLIEIFFPKKFGTYFEPFLGGGSVFFYVKQKYNPTRCIISDTNIDLVNTYRHVRDTPKKLIESLAKLKSQNSKEFYYKIREKFNNLEIKGIERSAAFIYLNKTCFNGLYRVNKQNKFNVPFGQLRNPSIFDEEIIFTASRILNDNVEIRCQDYQAIVSYVKDGDFVYLDPCYDPLKKTSFANYTPERFSDKDRDNLHMFIEALRRKGGKVVLSNNDVPQVRELYPKSLYRVDEITAPRFIGSKSNYREEVKELVISTRN